MSTYSVEVINKAATSFDVITKGYEFTVDTEGAGITPPDTLLASLGSCIGVYIRKYAEGAKITLGGFSIKVEAEFCKEHPVAFRQIRATVTFEAAGLEEHRKRAMLEFIKNCPVHNTLKSSPEIAITIA